MEEIRSGKITGGLFLEYGTLKGYVIIVSTCLFTAVYLYAAVISKLVPYSGITILDNFKDDCYYCFAIPLALLPTLLILYLNWLSIKLYESN